MESLSQKRSIFHLESDFQFALAWEIKCLYPECDIRLEVPFNLDKKGRIDIIVWFNNDAYPIELKYLKKPLNYKVGKEQFVLAEGVHDLDMYDCMGDIERMELFCNQLGGFHTGYVVWLTNDPAYWEKDYDASYYKPFHAPDGSIKTGEMFYSPVNPKTNKPPQVLQAKNYQNPIILSGSYQIKWNDYSDLGVPKGLLRYSIVSVDKG